MYEFVIKAGDHTAFMFLKPKEFVVNWNVYFILTYFSLELIVTMEQPHMFPGKKRII